jgi:hypothetical protein
MPVVIYSPGHYFYRVAEEAAVRSFQVSVAGKRNFQGRDKEAETARRHFGPVTADIEPVSANRGLRFRETGFYGQR